MTEFIAIMFFIMPKAILLVIPFGIFISIILYYDRIRRNSELLVLEASGLGKKQLAFPPFLLGLIGCLLSYGLTLYLVPKGNMMFRNSLRLVENNITNLLLTSESFNTFQDITLYLSSRSDNDMNFLTAYSGRPTDRSNKILHAKSAKLLDNDHLELYDGNIQEFKPGVDDELDILFFDKLTLNLDELYSVQGKIGQRCADLMYLGELLRIEKKSFSVRGEILNRILTPLFSLVLALMSAVFMLGANFSRTPSGNGLRNIFIYSLCALLSAAFFYLVRLARSGVLGFYLVAMLMLSQVVYIAFALNSEMRLLG
jgi:lipopolysaccharide export LptBFGC system permease protein LptF